jgi:hypothetical protein
MNIKLEVLCLTGVILLPVFHELRNDSDLFERTTRRMTRARLDFIVRQVHCTNSVDGSSNSK